MAITQGQIDALNAEANRLNAEAGTVESRLNNLESTVTQTIQATGARVESLATDILAQGEARLGAIERKVDTANASLEAIKQGILEIKAETASLAKAQHIIRRELDDTMHKVNVMLPAVIDRVRRDGEARFGVHNRLIGLLMDAVSKVRGPETGEGTTAGRMGASLYEHHRPAPLTAEGYEALDLPAAVYDAQGVEAKQYDDTGETAVTGWSDMDALTASEYDALQLTATAFAAYGLTAWLYDSAGKNLLV